MSSLREFGFPADVCVPYREPMEDWRPFLRQLPQERGIRHIFMYGDFIIPHRIAIEEAQALGIEAWVFELGYLRPNPSPWSGIGSMPAQPQSSLGILPRSSAGGSAAQQHRADPALAQGLKAPTFIQHAFTRYLIIEGEHKLQPTPGFLWCQLRQLALAALVAGTGAEVAIAGAPVVFPGGAPGVQRLPDPDGVALSRHA